MLRQLGKDTSGKSKIDGLPICRKYDDIGRVTQMDVLQKQYPVMQKLLDGEGVLSISAKEHGIFTEYLQLQLKMEKRERKAGVT